MNNQPKQDSRLILNTALELYYHATGTVVLSVELEKKDIQLDFNRIWAIAETLEKDGHISLIKDYSMIPVGRITGQGLVFFEQGGYKDDKSRVDKMIHWFKDNKFFSVLILGFMAFTSVLGIVKLITELIEWFK